MKLSFRWYGESDSIPLSYIRQIPNMHTVVSAVYDVKPGELWAKESLARLKKQAEENGLLFDVVESIPLPEGIKLGTEDAPALTGIWCENLRRCAEYGVRCVTYNFMPVFDWTRTELHRTAPDGSTALALDFAKLQTIDPMRTDINLPGWGTAYDKIELRGLLSAYAGLGEEGLWRNLTAFLKVAVPVAEKAGVRLAIHPDDPPYPVFGLPRIVTDEQNIDRLLSIVNSPANSLCFCTGSLGCVPGNDIPAMVRKYSAMDRIAFMHLRQVKRFPDGSFAEAGHFSGDGDLDLYEIVRALCETGFDGYVRPDHGRQIFGEDGKPGYGLFDRALGATYLNGLFEACEKACEKERR